MKTRPVAAKRKPAAKKKKAAKKTTAKVRVPKKQTAAHKKIEPLEPLDVATSENKSGGEPSADPVPMQIDGNDAGAGHTQGVGLSWQKKGEDKDQIFGAGGPQDGTALSLVSTSANAMLEDEAALYGQGDRTIDENEFTRSHANANTEFNFSQYKEGAARFNPGLLRAKTALEGAGLSSGDVLLRVDPAQQMVDRTMQALGGIYGSIYKNEERANLGYNDGLTNIQDAPNPFLMNKPMNLTDTANDERAGMNGEPVEEGVDDNDYYDLHAPYEDPANVEQIARQAKTGLRRVNMKKSQAKLMEQGARKMDMEEAYNEANSQYARVLRAYAPHGYLTEKDRSDTLSILRNPTSRFQASQVGVNELSSKTSKGFKTKKAKTGSKLAGHLVGI